MNYLEQLMLTLAGGLARCEPDRLRRHGHWTLGQMNADGGFSGREGPSDLYYTGFGLRTLALCRMLSEETAARVERFLLQKMQDRVGLVDFFSFIFSAMLLKGACGSGPLDQADSGWVERVEQELEQLRRPEGGYAASDQSALASTYHTFLVLLCRQAIGSREPQPQQVVRFLLSQQREDGGFVDQRVMFRSGVNPTAAAVESLRILEALEQPVAEGAAAFLAARQTLEGGLAANTRIAIADTLSTFTGLWTLAQLDALDRVDLDQVASYLREIELPAGGFLAAVIDQQADVEYTFYALGTLALLADKGVSV